MYVCMYVCMHARMHVCLCIFLCARVCMHVCVDAGYTHDLWCSSNASKQLKSHPNEVVYFCAFVFNFFLFHFCMFHLFNFACCVFLVSYFCSDKHRGKRILERLAKPPSILEPLSPTYQPVAGCVIWCAHGGLF